MAINDGRYIVVQFDQDLIGDLDYNSDRFDILAPVLYTNPACLEPVLTPLPITSVTWYHDRRDAILIELGNNNRETLQSAAGTVYVRYRGGTFRNDRGPLLPFMAGFDPIGVDYKGDQNNVEHLELRNISNDVTVTKISRSSGYSPVEHVSFEDVNWTYKVTKINEL